VAAWEILYIYRARLRARLVLVQELLAIVGIAVGVALLFASQVASTSLNGSVAQLASEIVGRMQYQVVARSPQGLDQRLLAEVRHIPGVLAALPVLERQVSLIGPTGQESIDLIGTDPRFAHLGGPLLRHFSYAQLESQHALALPGPAARSIGAGPLQPVRLRVGAHIVPTLVGATLEETDIGGLVHSPVALAPIAYTQQIAGMRGRITRILVRSDSGHGREVQARLSSLAAAEHLNAEPANFDATLFRVAAAPANASTSLFSAISALVGFMFAFNAMLVTLPLRRRLIETLRRSGASRSMTVQVLLFDALVLGTLGSLLGVGLGEVLSIAVFRVNPGYLSFAFPIGAQRIVTWQSVALAMGAGLLAACVGVMAPLRDIIARPLRVAGESVRPRRGWTILRLAIGVTCLAVTTIILLADPQAAVLGSVTLVVALLSLLPILFYAVLAGFDRLQRPLYAASTRIAVIELQTPSTRVRSLAIAATGAIAVFGSVAILGAQSNLQHGLDRTASDINLVTDLWVSPAGSGNTLGTTPFPAGIAGRLARLPGVRTVSIYRGSFLDIGNRRVWLLAPPRTSPQPIPPSQLVSGDLARSTALLRGHGWAVVSQAIAHEHHLEIGRSFTLSSPRPTVFRVAAMSTNIGWPPGAIIINADDYASAWGSPDASAYNIALASGFSPAQGRLEIRRALGTTSGLAVQTAPQRAQEWRSTSHQGLSRLTQIAALVLIAAILATAGAMVSMIWQRRRQFAYIKRQGYKRGVLWRALLCESALLLGTGCSIGALFGLYGQLLLSHALATVTGFPVIFSLGGMIAIFSFALVSAVAIAILALPGYLAVRVRPTTVSAA
jgi:putative ABC transport system permease protein